MTLAEIAVVYIPLENRVRYMLLKLALARGKGPRDIAARLALAEPRYSAHWVERFLLMRGKPRSAQLRDLADIAYALDATLEPSVIKTPEGAPQRDKGWERRHGR